MVYSHWFVSILHKGNGVMRTPGELLNVGKYIYKRGHMCTFQTELFFPSSAGGFRKGAQRVGSGTVDGMILRAMIATQSTSAVRIGFMELGSPAYDVMVTVG